MATLDLKLFRDFKRLWPQALAISLVIAGGVASLVLSVGSFRSLEETRSVYYEQYRFADVFASVARAPRSLLADIKAIPGVGMAEGRIGKLALLDIPRVSEPATGLFISLPQAGPTLNLPYLKSGRLPDPNADSEVIVSDGFAVAHGFAAGDSFSALLNGKRRQVTIVGTALSPEFVYAIGPGDRMPDEWRFAIVWMPERALAAAYGLSGAFSQVSLKLLPNSSELDARKRLDALLEPFGGTASYGRKDQTSHAFLDHALDMLRSMSSTLPPIFLLVTAFLVNLVLSRLIALEREQIGLLKAVGYGNGAIAGHYAKFVSGIAALGIVIGSLVGTWGGEYVTQLFGQYYKFPFLVFAQSPDLYALGAVLSLAAAAFGAYRAIAGAVRLPPAVAMQPPAPPRYGHVLPSGIPLLRWISQPVMMTLRGLARRPMRTTLTILGIGAATGILIVSLFTGDAINQLVDVTYFMADRQDATIGLVAKQNADVAREVARLPGVLTAEPVRDVPARIRFGSIERRIAISARSPEADLSRIIDTDLQNVVLPESGLAVSAYLADVLGAQVGDTVELDLLEGRQRTVSLQISALVEDYFGIRAMMDARALAQLMRESPKATAINVSVDEGQIAGLFQAIKGIPMVAGIALQSTALANFRKSLAITITTMATIYTTLGAIIAFGIVYNSARISLSERARELASLRVLGFTQWEVIRILLLELALITVVAQPFGWAFGFGLSAVMRGRLAGELMRVPMVIQNLTFSIASAIIVVAAAASALIVARRIASFDLIAVLKTRD